MSKEEWFKFQEKFFTEIIELGKKKNADYTSKDDTPFANFELVEKFGIAKTEQGFLTRMIDKMQRVKSFVNNGELQVKEESVNDALMDLAGYCSLFAGYLESKKECLKM